MGSLGEDTRTAVLTSSDSTLSARAYLDNLMLHGIKLGLQNIESLLREGARPHLAYPVVHVAGTNGKGSVLAFLDAILLASGYKTGRFTSPHLMDVTERFLINGAPITDRALEEHVQWCRQSAEKARCVPTYFEACTALAFRSFQKEAVDAALVEVGMGGRFDSTNLVQPSVCAITNIALDHTQYLGSTLAEIAGEKAGIIKKGAPVVTGKMDNAALRVIEKEAREKDAPLYREGIEYSVGQGGSIWAPELHYEGLGVHLEGIKLGLAGMHQVGNAAIALTLALLLQQEFPQISQESIRCGLEKAIWPGRLEVILKDPPVLMDVAHNPAGCGALISAINSCVIVFAVSSDKDARTMLSLLKPLADPLILTRYSGERSLSLEKLTPYAQEKSCLIFPTLGEALERGKEEASEDKPLLITGSIYACGEARDYMMKHWGIPALTFYQP
jgi:dihydrofolate synthase/folylpolyglutamate synthase